MSSATTFFPSATPPSIPQIQCILHYFHLTQCHLPIQFIPVLRMKASLESFFVVPPPGHSKYFAERHGIVQSVNPYEIDALLRLSRQSGSRRSTHCELESRYPSLQNFRDALVFVDAHQEGKLFVMEPLFSASGSVIQLHMEIHEPTHQIAVLNHVTERSFGASHLNIDTWHIRLMLCSKTNKLWILSLHRAETTGQTFAKPRLRLCCSTGSIFDEEVHLQEMHVVPLDQDTWNHPYDERKGHEWNAQMGDNQCIYFYGENHILYSLDTKSNDGTLEKPFAWRRFESFHAHPIPVETYRIQLQQRHDKVYICSLENLSMQGMDTVLYIYDLKRKTVSRIVLAPREPHGTIFSVCDVVLMGESLFADVSVLDERLDLHQHFLMEFVVREGGVRYMGEDFSDLEVVCVE